MNATEQRPAVGAPIPAAELERFADLLVRLLATTWRRRQRQQQQDAA